MALEVSGTGTTAATPVSAWRSVLVYGLGLSGVAASRALSDRDVRVVAVDGRPATDLGTAARELLRTGRVGRLLAEEGASLPASVDAVVLSPGVPPDRPLLRDARSAGVPVLAEVELAWRLLEAKAPPIVLGVTGSNGKSTTTALTGALLEAAGYPVEVCGNIGTPLCARVDGPPDRVFVVELSSFQLEAVDRFRPRAAALLNISPDHLDRYASVAEYAGAKARIFGRQAAGDVAVVNADDSGARSWSGGRRGAPVAVRRRFFSRLRKVEDGCYLDRDRVIEVGPEFRRELFRLGDLRLDGLHNVENAMAAALLATAVGADPSGFAPALRGFGGLPHRMRLAGTVGGVRYYNDSKATNPAAALKALAGFSDGSVHLILGGRAKDEAAAFAELASVAAVKAAAVYLIGEAAPIIASVLADATERRLCGTLERAVRAASAASNEGQTVLLSPACASFDQFEDFADRGRRFEEQVRTLAAAGPEGGHG
ncbi:MAG: UDP-N-acetylmuramoyl-L-alanine--D-glutamate ligase [Holophagales bacterium]|nr:UDP-N-acetylmuramoyl-L-alanine--D-glutamate ligase [Holophagales bacterium]MYH25391.1 UDP-N-acetylmuramoyl-L-alanine--D-glutamate ligase [Holophagales bacterium]